MRLTLLTGCTLAAALLAGCSGGSGAVVGSRDASASASVGSSLSAVYRSGGPATLVSGRPFDRPREASSGLPGWVRLASGAQQGDVYVSQFNGIDVNEYTKNNRQNAGPLCQIPATIVNGIAVDQQKNLWVPAGTLQSETGTITVYAPNCGPVVRTLQDRVGQPADVAFDQHHNTFVANILGVNGVGSVSVYRPGSPNPSRTLTDPTFLEVFGVALDRKDNLFVSYVTFDLTGHVIAFAGGKMPGKVLSNVNLGYAGNLRFDSAGNMLAIDQNIPAVQVYAPPYDRSPTTIVLNGESAACTLSRGDKRLYCGDFPHGLVDVYSYSPLNPGGSKYLYSFSNGLSPAGAISGLATAPAPAP